MDHQTDDIVKLVKELLLVYQTTPPSIRFTKEDSQLLLTLKFEKKRKIFPGYKSYVTISVRYALVILTKTQELRDITLTFSTEAQSHRDSTYAIVSKFFPKEKFM